MRFHLRSIALTTGLMLAAALPGAFAQTPDTNATQAGTTAPAPVDNTAIQDPATTAAPTTPAPATTTEAGEGVSGTQTANVGDAYLSGLINVNIQNLNLQAQDVIDIENILNNNQIPILLQALTANSTATQNASTLTEQLQTQGLLAADEEIVGFKDGKAVKAKKSTIEEAKVKKDNRGQQKKADRL